mgnify:CR=1 FL=1
MPPATIRFDEEFNLNTSVSRPYTLWNCRCTIESGAIHPTNHIRTANQIVVCCVRYFLNFDAVVEQRMNAREVFLQNFAQFDPHRQEKSSPSNKLDYSIADL